MYNVNDPDIIETLTLLTGSRETATNIYMDAQHIFNTLNIEKFHVQQKDGRWHLAVDDITVAMNKTLSIEE